jgi:hypothetical protein
MRAFWAVLAALLVGGCVYVVVAARANTNDAATAQAAAMKQSESDADAAAQQKKDAGDLASPQRQQEFIAQQPASKEQTAKPAPLANPVAAVAPDAPKPEAKPETPKPEAPKPDAPTADAPKTDAAPAPAAPTADGYKISGGSIAPVGVTGTPTDATKPVVATVKQDKPPTFQGFEVIPAKIEKKDDGSMLVDGQYVIKGEGTTEKPYLVPWDVLTSVEETFDPQSGKKKLPERVTMLDGKVVKLSGYVAFPLMMKEAKECLSMLNQWDGCCIGVPPTPYDAVEVSLTRVIKGEERFTTSGHVIGTFKVKPYLQGDWLIGLYVMEQSDLKSKDYGGAAGS